MRSESRRHFRFIFQNKKPAMLLPPPYVWAQHIYGFKPALFNALITLQYLLR